MFRPGEQVCLSHRRAAVATLVGIERAGAKRIATIKFPCGEVRKLSVKGIRKAKTEPTEAEMLSELFAARGWTESKVRRLANGNAFTVRDVYDAVFKDDAT